MKKSEVIKKIICWCLVALFGIQGGITFFGGDIVGMLWLLIVPLWLPIERWQKFRAEKLKINDWVSLILSVVLIVIGALLQTEWTDTENVEVSGDTVITTTITETNTSTATTIQ